MSETGSNHPDTIDQFRIERTLQDDDYRVVYRAIDEEENRASAVKVVRSDSAAFSQAFEAWRDGRFDHPAIVKVHGAGEYDGRKYVAVEFADGDTLQGWLREVRRSIPAGSDVSQRLVGEYVATVVQKFHELALALQTIHNTGHAHGNIKPSNIVVVSPQNVFKLTDIGVTAIAFDNTADNRGMSVDEVAYLAPERLHSKPLDVNARLSDIYSLGVVMYETLTLAYPHKSADMSRYVAQAMTERPVPARAHNASLPVTLEAVLMKAIERDTSDRYQSAGKLADDLQNVIMNQPVSAPHIGASERLLGSLKARWPVTLGVLVVIFIILTIWWIGEYL